MEAVPMPGERTRKVKTKSIRGKPDARSLSRLGAEDLPRKTLEEAVRVGECLHSQFAGRSTAWNDLADALKIGRETNSTKYLFWSAAAYGLINKEPSNSYSLAETGRKILSPIYESEGQEAKLKALLTPNILSRFYTDYNNHLLPTDAIFSNVLERKYGVPRERIQEAKEVIIANGRFAGILREDDEKQSIMLGMDSVVPETTGLSVPVTTDHESARSVISEWAKICFYITPIGEDGTEVRKHADMMLKHLVEPAVQDLGMTVVRADKIEKSGLITQQVFEFLAYSGLCIADLSFNNPNAFYELGVRHMCVLPTIQIIRKGDKIPFDVSQGRTIVVDTSDIYTVIDKFESARKELAEHLKASLQGAKEANSVDNPVLTYLPGIKISLPPSKS
jgi:hypothetical protein